MPEHTLDPMRLVFRADASKNMGVGHVMRCCSIAEEAISRGIPCVLIGDLGGLDWLEKQVRFVGVSYFSEAQFSSFRDFTGDVLIIDSYNIPVTENFIELNRWRFVVSIFDQITPNYRASIYIHPGIDIVDHTKRIGKVYSGASYIPFRKSIIPVQRNIESINKLLIFSGGTDPFSFAEQIAKVLLNFIEFNEATFLSENKNIIEELDSRFSVSNFGNNLDDLVGESDLVLTSASTSSLEIAVRGLAVGVASVTTNQDSNYTALSQNQIAAPIGRRNHLGEWKISEDQIGLLLRDAKFRKKLISNAVNKIDLNGSKRIVDLILNYSDV